MKKIKTNSYFANMEYKIYESNLEKYIEMNGKRNSRNPICKGLKENTARYYIIEENGDFFDDFAIYLDEDNMISIDQRYFFKDDLMEELVKFLKLEYKSIKIFVDLEKIHLIEVIKKRFENIEIETVVRYGYDFNRITIML